MRDSGGTVIFTIRPALTGGSKRTAEFAAKHRKPYLRLHAGETVEDCARRLVQSDRRIVRTPPPDPPFDIDTFEPIEPPRQAIREWIPDDDAEPRGDLFDQRPNSGKPVEILREDGSILVLDSD